MNELMSFFSEYLFASVTSVRMLAFLPRKTPDRLRAGLAAISPLCAAYGQPAWRDELLSVYCFGDIACESPLTVIERAMCRPFAFNTFAVHLNPFTRDGRMWVAQRSFKKAIGPGYWDNCAAQKE